MARKVIPETEVLEFIRNIPLNKERTFYIKETDEKFIVFEKMTKEIKNWEEKTIHCLNCPNLIQCRCIEFDTDRGTYYFCSLECYEKFNDKQEMNLDLEFGQYEGHHFDCELGGHFEEKWKELIKDRTNYQDLYYEFHAMWKKLKHPEEKINPIPLTSNGK